MPRTLAATVRRFVNHTSRNRGESYFRSGRVSVIQSDSERFSASVRGTQRYDVSLQLDDDRLIVKCTCPYFEGSIEPCKHIWATILAADQARRFHVPSDLSLDFDDDPTDAADLDDSDDGLLDEEVTPDLRESGVRPGVRRFSAAQRRAIADRMKPYWSERRRRVAPISRPVPPPRPAPPPAWQRFLSHVTPSQSDVVPARALHTGELIYVLDLARSAMAGGLLIELLTRERKKSGDWAKPKTLTITRRDVALLPDERDRRILDAVCGATHAYAYSGDGYSASLPVPSTFLLNPTLQRDLVPRLCQTGRLLLRSAMSPADQRPDAPLIPIEWDPQPATFLVCITGDAHAGYTIAGRICSAEHERGFDSALFVTGALILWHSAQPDDQPRFAALETGGADRWMAQLLKAGPVTVPAADAPVLAEALANSDLARLECPDELRVEVRAEAPRPVVRITRPKTDNRGGYDTPGDRLDATLSFAYGETEMDAWSVRPVIVDAERRVTWRRDREAERGAMARLQSLGVRRLADWQTGGTRLDLSEKVLPTLVRVLLAEGWRVEAEGRLYRQPGTMALDVRSGIDWFELHGGVDFDGIRADLPTLLAAARRGDSFVPLGDGTFGLLPEAWLARGGRVATIGTREADHVRFAPSQAALLDAWLATQPAVSCDEAFARARGELARFEGVAALDAPPTFNGVLRGYQRDALGWFGFLRRFGFGGCLADEMGLGKTVMVLAAMEDRRLEHTRTGRASRPSLIVVPRSLVFNWRQEAARFAPALRVLDFTGGGRRGALDEIGEHDIVLTTYGTLRRDIGHLKEIAFDYAILDEAQAIKNARTSSAKAARLLKADHRLALSGTPVENHLGELWSLFDFLNPGILGAASFFSVASASGRPADEEMLAILARGLRPFILRRTKEQVASELPPRTEQTLYCDLEPPQRALYNELRDHYRASLLGKVARDGLGRAKLQFLEALLRLRQAACHPGLVDRARVSDPAAKLDVLVPRLQELVEDGRKVIVFSQFTTLLGLLRTRLDETKLTYEYLDGKTRDRQARVERFQGNGCPLFLVSLKAGGLGLNLTAAEYVFLLDPWWNPAVEAQAIDRAHRIGQTRPVFAFRLIARDTVEEKVLELQATKRRLADAIVRADASLIRDLRREDLELLLS
jgi:superfamily II DNA or RNA helicase